MGTEVDPSALTMIGEITLPYIADFYDEMSNRLGAIGQTAGTGLIPDQESGAGNALGEAIITCHRFLYAVTEETADSHRAVGRAVAEAGYDYQQADEESAAEFSISEEEITDSTADHFEDVDAGEYDYADSEWDNNLFESDSHTGSNYEAALSEEPVQPVDYQDYEIKPAGADRGSEMNEWAEQTYGVEAD
ncbi:hypothetical protein [Glycomyces arizonensis]|uniref:hypothetical protein n=1 Tax=Glycomyces arizonensis TaxID=256035 RepID=UPI0003FC34E4|nr:hypothetical protein [Glycomyces arizonensis]